MADQSLRFLKGMVKDVIVRIQEQYIPTDFRVLDMQGDDETPILLERLFLYTAKANIYIGLGHIHFNLPTGKVHCQFRTLVNREQITKQCNRRRRQACHQATQPHCEWEVFPGRIMKYEDRFTDEEENTQAPRWSEWAEES